ncbi:hypothetical protein IWW50_005463, partial [Coemansia erecta]
MELGATHFVDTSNSEDVESVKRTLNYLFVTSNSQSNQYNEYISWMDYEGQIVLLALPKGQMQFKAGEFIQTEVAITGSLIGGVNVLKKTLEFSAEHNVLPMIERFPIEKVNEALEHVDSGKARYRVVLEGQKTTRLSKTQPVLQPTRRLRSDPRCQVRTLTISAFVQDRALDNKAAHSPPSELSSKLSQLSAAGRWDHVWALLHSEWTTAKRDPDIECMKQLIEHALAGQNSQAAIRLAQKLVVMNTRNSQVASILTDDWIAGVLCSALGLAAVSGSDQKHPFVDITFALFMIEHPPRGKRPRYSESRVLMCAYQLLSSESPFDTDYITAELKAATTKYVLPDENEINSQP